MRLAEELTQLWGAASGARSLANDADAIAAGVAATRGQLNKLTRVWTLGNGIGYGRWPYVDGVWEGGHITVTLDPKERFCGCGGVGHLEGIMGYRAMRLRFLDLEPEEVFANAKQGDARCREFVDLWHRALAAATASFIHLAGPGPLLFHRPQCGLSRSAHAARPSRNHGQDEPAAKLLAGNPAPGRRNRPAGRRRLRTPRFGKLARDGQNNWHGRSYLCPLRDRLLTRFGYLALVASVLTEWWMSGVTLVGVVGALLLVLAIPCLVWRGWHF